ncbi:MAG TPA: ChbG/HpnK family deacetylase [Accumulibacter sp.]|nr:ChbG/HpnK family deacetylase [Accumulibacter sp.]
MGSASKVLNNFPEAFPKRIAICADDFGLAAGIDEGILALARLGHLSAVSCLTPGTALPHHSAALAQLPVDLGLHLNFTESLVADQLHLPLARLIAACYTRRLPPLLVASTIAAQFDAFEANFGRPPAFIDGHQHVHQLPVIRELLLESIGRRYPGRVIWLRSTQTARNSTVARADQRKARLIALLGARALRRLTTAAGLPMNRHLLGVYRFSASCEQYRKLLQAWFADAGSGDLLMCHPAVSAPAGDPIGRQRMREFAVLSDKHFPTWIDASGLTVSRLLSV